MAGLFRLHWLARLIKIRFITNLRHNRHNALRFLPTEEGHVTALGFRIVGECFVLLTPRVMFGYLFGCPTFSVLSDASFTCGHSLKSCPTK